MVTKPNLDEQRLEKIANDGARSLSCKRVSGETIFINTTVNYPNGTSVVVRIDGNKNNFCIPDDAQASVYAKFIDGGHQFNYIARLIATRFSIKFEKRHFFIGHIL